VDLTVFIALLILECRFHGLVAEEFPTAVNARRRTEALTLKDFMDVLATIDRRRRARFSVTGRFRRGGKPHSRRTSTLRPAAPAAAGNCRWLGRMDSNHHNGIQSPMSCL
jgi:hypothetical protein